MGLISDRRAWRVIRRLPILALPVIAVFATHPVAFAQEKKPPTVRPESAAAPEPKRTFPSLPGAVRSPPQWVKKDLPFDIVQFFESIPESENAAPLYLEALYEISPSEMKDCVSPEHHAARGPFLEARYAGTIKLMSTKPDQVDRAEIADNLLEYRDAFAKLAQAQQRPKCVFETGISIDSLVPHARACRQVVRLLEWQVKAHLADGQIEAAIDDIAIALRLSRDLRPRGPLISQLVSFALDAVISSSLLPMVLAAKGLSVAHCDRLLELVTLHVEDMTNPLVEGCRHAYVMFRDLLHRLETKDESESFLQAIQPYKKVVAAMTSSDFAAEVVGLNRWAGPLVNAQTSNVRELRRLIVAQNEALREMKIVPAIVPSLLEMTELPNNAEAYRRNRTRLGATRCLIALRRWQLKSMGANPPDLQVLCKEVGMNQVPVDEYSEKGEPLRFRLIAGEFIVYSVAGDGKDDWALADWEFGKQPGDWIFRLPARP
ncbi:MAG: hypothetical protein HY290_04800 [Planctomycetia bacterium]|nr:hypothetical protein [Planctomycetia bacterium]